MTVARNPATFTTILPVWLLSAALCPANAQPVSIPPGYEIVRITNTPYREVFARLNNSGQVVFTRWFDFGEDRSTQEIYLYDSSEGELTRLTNDDIQDVGADINDDGVICWSRRIGYPGAIQAPGEIVIYRNGQIARLTDNPHWDENPRINRWGEIVWERYYIENGLGADIFHYDGQSIRQVTTDGWTEGVTNSQCRINDLGQIIWTRVRFDLNPWTSKTMLHENGVTREITNGQSTPMAPDINNQSVATWTHRLVPGETAIDLWQNGQATLFTDWGGFGTLNDRGQLALSRWHEDTDTWQQWLYRDDQFYRLTDDPFGARRGEINERGEVAWDAGHLDRKDMYLLRRFAFGDLNCDRIVDAFDIEPFILALSDPQMYRSRHPACDPMLADVNEDQAVNALDIEPFIDLLTQ